MPVPPAQNRVQMIAEVAAMVAVMNELPNVDAQLEWLDENGWTRPSDTENYWSLLESKDELIEDLMTTTTRVAA